MWKIVNTLEALLGIFGAIWFFLYLTGRLNYVGDKEKERQEKVKKYGWLLILGIIFCIIGSLMILLGTLN